jgi:hypothetical protein
MRRVVQFLLLVLFLGITLQPASADERIWVHVSYLDDYINSLCFVGGAIPITMNFRLYDDNGYYLDIAPYSCIDMGKINTTCTNDPRDGYWRLSQAWYIDTVTRTEPTQDEQEETSCSYNDCVPAWNPVDIPTGFEPTRYRYGCSDLFASFQIPDSDPDTNPDNDSSSGGGGGGGCFISTF